VRIVGPDLMPICDEPKPLDHETIDRLTLAGCGAAIMQTVAMFRAEAIDRSAGIATNALLTRSPICICGSPRSGALRTCRTSCCYIGNVWEVSIAHSGRCKSSMGAKFSVTLAFVAACPSVRTALVALRVQRRVPKDGSAVRMARDMFRTTELNCSIPVRPLPALVLTALSRPACLQNGRVDPTKDQRRVPAR